MIQNDPSLRPSSEQLLQDLQIDKDLVIKKLQNENEKLAIENYALCQENQEKNLIIENQKRKIDELQAQLKKLET